MDKRTEYIVSCASTALGVNQNGAATKSAVADFLESPTARVLQAYPKDGGLEFSTTASLSREISTAVIFTKRGSEPLTPDNIASAVLMSKVSNPLETLQLALTELYGPVLLQSGQVSVGHTLALACQRARWPRAPCRPNPMTTPHSSRTPLFLASAG